MSRRNESTSGHDLDPRSRQLLRTLIARHIRDGEPVGSQTLSRHSGLEVSPATIRNILADLEDAGFLSAPHTSAGRVPTDRGYRFYADALLAATPATTGEAPEEVELTRMRREVEDAMR